MNRSFVLAIVAILLCSCSIGDKQFKSEVLVSASDCDALLSKAYHIVNVVCDDSNAYNKDPSTQGALNFVTVELDDFGEFRDEEQVDAVFKAIQSSTEEGSTLLLTYIHGWKHNASENSSDLKNFRSQVFELAKNPCVVEGSLSEGSSLSLDDCRYKHVVGIYVAWRGDAFNLGKMTRGLFGTPRHFTFWNRINATQKVANTNVTNLLLQIATRLREGDEKRMKSRSKFASCTFASYTQSQDVCSRGIVVGHSMGGRVLEYAVAQAMLGSRFMANSIDLENQINQSQNNAAQLSDGVLNSQARVEEFEELKRTVQTLTHESDQKKGELEKNIGRQAALKANRDKRYADITASGNKLPKLIADNTLAATQWFTKANTLIDNEIKAEICNATDQIIAMEKSTNYHRFISRVDQRIALNLSKAFCPDISTPEAAAASEVSTIFENTEEDAEEREQNTALALRSYVAAICGLADISAHSGSMLKLFDGVRVRAHQNSSDELYDECEKISIDLLNSTLITDRLADVAKSETLAEQHLKFQSIADQLQHLVKLNVHDGLPTYLEQSLYMGDFIAKVTTQLSGVFDSKYYALRMAGSNDFSAELTNRGNNIRSVVASTVAMVEKLDKLAPITEALRKDIDALKAKAVELQNTIDSTDNTLTRLKNIFDSLERTIKEDKTRITSMRSEFVDSVSNIEKMFESVLKPPFDLALMVNPATGSIETRMLANSLCEDSFSDIGGFDDLEPGPWLVSIASQNDVATSKVFSFARGLERYFDIFNPRRDDKLARVGVFAEDCGGATVADISQEQMYKTTAPFIDELQTHQFEYLSENELATLKESECFVDESDIPSGSRSLTQGVLIGADLVKASRDNPECVGYVGMYSDSGVLSAEESTHLRLVKKHDKEQHDYWIIKIDKSVIPDHGKIFSYEVGKLLTVLLEKQIDFGRFCRKPENTTHQFCTLLEKKRVELAAM